ncbi:MAG: DUF5329 domain-containing protein [Pseudomonadales bacterium]
MCWTTTQFRFIPNAFIYLLLTVTANAFAATEQEIATDQEITHLLDFVEHSRCNFNRNGTVHKSLEARQHMELKYGYAKRWVGTAEDFIKYTATQSTISKRPYHVVCDGQQIPSAEWLIGELKKYRDNNLKG